MTETLGERAMRRMAITCARTNPDICIAVVEGCEDCALDVGRGDHDQCDDMCRFDRDEKRRDPEYHAVRHRPFTCAHCGHVIDDHRGNRSETATRCGQGCCGQLRCPGCDTVVMSDGPVGCPECSPIEEEETIR